MILHRSGNVKKRNWFSYICYRIIRPFVWLFFKKMKVEGIEKLPEDACIAVGNHSQMNGPLSGEFYFPGKRKIWCAHQMMYLKEVPAYAFQDFWSAKPKSVRWLYKIASYLIAPLSVCIFSNARTIPVFRDNRLITTFKLTVNALSEGESVIIFPECYEPYNHIVYTFQDRFIDVAKLYYKRTGKAVSFVPVYIAPNLKTMYIGKPIAYDPQIPMEEQRKEIARYLMDAITEMAVSLPRHKVVPYPNMPKEDYPYNKPEEEKEK
jgi:hypothetical protein